MDLERTLAAGVLAAQPIAAAAVLERLPVAEVAALLAEADAGPAAAALAAMHGPTASATLEALTPARAATLLGTLPLGLASVCLRDLGAERREALLALLEARRARALRSLLRFEPHTAGGCMDPSVLGLPGDLTVSEAIERVREAARDARYNVYVLDRDHRLTGVLNLREIFLGDAEAPLASIARPDPHRLAADADRHAILAHPGWREVHALPVVDRDGVYLGAIRYRTLRRLEAELRGPEAEAGATARALADLFRTGATSVLEAVAASARLADEAPEAK